MWKDVKDILMSESLPPLPERESRNSDLYKDNLLFTRFEHLFDYESSFHSYLVAKVCAYEMYGSAKGQPKLPWKLQQLFTKGGAFDYRNQL